MQPIKNDNQGQWIFLAALVGLVSLMNLNTISFLLFTKFKERVKLWN